VDLSRPAAAAPDDADPLAGFRARFTGTHDDGPGRLLYLDGNSLGRLPTEPPAAVARVVEQECDRYVVAGVAAQRGMTVREVDAHADEGLEPGVLAAALDERVAVVVLSQVADRSGALVDVAVVTAPT
jgi:kynureninase